MTESEVEAAILEYCTAREALMAHRRTTKDERTEHVDAEKTLQGLLVESMQKHEITCICLGDDVGADKYLRMVPAPKRSMKIKTKEDLLSLVANMTPHLTTVAKADVAHTVVQIFKQRAKERGPPVGKPRILVAKRMATKSSAANITERDMLPNETKNLSLQYLEARNDLLDARQQVKPLRARQVEAEERLLPLLPVEGALVRVSGGGKGRKEKTIRLQRVDPTSSHTSQLPDQTSTTGPPDQTPPPPSDPTLPPDSSSSDPMSSSPAPQPPPTTPNQAPPSSIGMRLAVAMVRDAAEEASGVRLTPTMDFDEALKACLIRRIDHYRKPIVAKKPVIKARKAIFP